MLNFFAWTLDYENAKKIRFADENLCCLRSSLYVAQKMGKKLGRGAVLQRCVSGEEANCRQSETLNPQRRGN